MCSVSSTRTWKGVHCWLLSLPNPLTSSPPAAAPRSRDFPSACAVLRLRVRGTRCASRPLFLIVGSDAASGLPTWERGDEVRKLATVVVVNRPGAEEGKPPKGWSWEGLVTPRLEVSSTDLRARFADGRPLDYLLTTAV